MALVGGAAVGLGLLPLGSRTGAIGPDGPPWQAVVIVSYGALSGVTMAAFVLLILDRIRSRRTWGPAAVSLFVAGLTAWLFLPMVAATWVQQSNAFEPFRLFLHLIMAHQPGAYAFEAFYHFWPIACASLLVACILSGQAPRWWRLRGWWAEWLGMWVLVAWSVPCIPILVGFFRVYFR